MSLDLFILLILVLFAVAGAFSGALRQLTRLAAILAGWGAARWLGPRAAEAWAGPSPHPWQRAVAAAGCFALAGLLVSIAGRAVARRLHGPDGEPGATDRACGALLGGGGVALVAWILLSALALAHGPLSLGPLTLDARRSDFGSFALRHNLLSAADPVAARTVERLLELWRDPAARQRVLHEDPGLRRLVEDPRWRALMERGRGSPAAREKVEELLADPEVRHLLEQPAPDERKVP